MIEIPPSKSHLMRAILFASLAKGESTITRLLHSPDIKKMIEACRAFGAHIQQSDDELQITGVGGKPDFQTNLIDCGNSGIVLRFVGAIAALDNKPISFTGDESVRKRRPVGPLIDGLNQLGAHAEPADPLRVQGPLKGGKATISGADSQPVSALMIAAHYFDGEIDLRITDPGEEPWVALTRWWLDRMDGNGFTFSTPGDYSSAAFPIAAALVTETETMLSNLDPEDVQGDRQLLSVLQRMGAEISHTHIRPSQLHGIEIDVNPFIDALPILTVLGCKAEGETRIVNGAIARKKESDRISVITSELRKMGADIEELPDGLVVRKSQLQGAEVDAHRDHRIAMSLGVAALMAEGETIIKGGEWVEKSYPGFWEIISDSVRTTGSGKVHVRGASRKSAQHALR